MKYAFTFSLILISSFLIGQINPVQNDSRIGYLKTVEGKTLGYGFVAMNKNVIFTAADNITFDQEMVFEDQEENIYQLRVVATDKVGNIGVLMASKTIHQEPFALNLNFAIDGETQLSGFHSSDADSMTKGELVVVSKKSTIEKSKEFKFVEVFIEGNSNYTGSPILNAYGEVIGLTSSQKLNDDKTSVLTVSIMDGQMWKKM